ncbi:Riboflavin transporter MCH5 [Leucoagaricus sp. SymC.cos]|nr:Riboflavin transporter MCH5 [Leucoagaricus sp. SymC.cos]
MTVAGSWLILFSTLGYIYSFGVYEDYYTRIFLTGHSPSSIALFMLSLAQEGQYYQVFLSQGVGMGVGTGLLFTPSTAIVSVHFKRRRSLAYGAALTGISIGALLFPIVLNQLIPRFGFADTVRITGYITLGCLTAGIALIRPPPRVSRNQQTVADISSFFHDPPYLWFLFTAIVSLLSIYFPAIYLQLYAVDHNIGDSLAFYSIAILNGVGIVGRVGSTWLADKYGIWNVQTPVTLGTAATIWAILGVWMGSFQLALPFAMGPLAGRVFDAGCARLIVAMGSLLFVFSLFMLSLAQEGQYYQVFLSQGVGMGVGTGLLFTPSTAIVSVHFKRRRSLAYGAALTGISIGALLFPIVLKTLTSETSQLIPRFGFADTVRITGYITLGCLTAGIALIRPPPRVSRNQQTVADISSFFHDPPYLWFLFTAIVSLLSIYFPAIYLQLYAVDHNIGDSLAFYSIAILNGVGIVGRVGSTWLADKYGIWNVQTPVTLGTAATIWAILGVHSPATLVVVSCLYGIFSGAWLAVSVSGLVSLASSPSEVGVRVGIANAFMSLGLLASGPLQGALLSSQFHWIRPNVFSATLMSISTVFSIIIRTLISKRKNSQWI